MMEEQPNATSYRLVSVLKAMTPVGTMLGRPDIAVKEASKPSQTCAIFMSAPLFSNQNDTMSRIIQNLRDAGIVANRGGMQRDYLEVDIGQPGFQENLAALMCRYKGLIVRDANTEADLANESGPLGLRDVAQHIPTLPGGKALDPDSAARLLHRFAKRKCTLNAQDNQELGAIVDALGIGNSLKFLQAREQPLTSTYVRG